MARGLSVSKHRDKASAAQSVTSRAPHACGHLHRALRARWHCRRLLRAAPDLGASLRPQLRAGRHFAHGLLHRHGLSAAAGRHVGRAGRRARAVGGRLDACWHRLRAAGGSAELRDAGGAHSALRRRLGSPAPDCIVADLAGLCAGVPPRCARRLQFHRRCGKDGCRGRHGARCRDYRLAQQRRGLRCDRCLRRNRGAGCADKRGRATLSVRAPRRRHLRRRVGVSQIQLGSRC